MPDIDPLNPAPNEISETSELTGLDPGELLARGLNTVTPSAGAQRWQPPAPEEVARLLPQYHIESLLGAGGMGAVYKGVQPTLERSVAIKLLPAEVAADQGFITRFQREARTLAKLHHPSIVSVYDFGQTSEGHLYFVMEYVDGTDLRRVLHGPGLDPEQALMVITQICEALHAAHQQGVIHRDIKPENILITSEGYVKLADFGLARPLIEDDSGRLTGTHIVMGTLDYMAPEQREGHGDHRADIFALGVMLYEMLTGTPPRGVFLPPSQKVQVDVRIDEVVIKALQAEPDRRYQQASEMKMDVDRIRTEAAVPKTPSAPAAPPPPSGARAHRGRTFALLAAILVPILGLLAYFVWQSGKNTDLAGHVSSNPNPVPTSVPVPTPATAEVALGKTTPLAAPPNASSRAGPQARSIFNGKDLTEWDGRPDIWSVEDGAITGITTDEHRPIGDTSLVWKGGAVSDFELTCRVKVVPTEKNRNTTAGVQFRAMITDPSNFTLSGYTVSMSAGRDWTGRIGEHGDPYGRMYGVDRGQKAIIKDTNDPIRPFVDIIGSVSDIIQLYPAIKIQDWNNLKIVAVGNHFQVFLNGLQTADVLNESPRSAKSGVLGLGILYSFIKAQFKDITFKDLSGAQSPLAQAQSAPVPKPVTSAVMPNLPPAHTPSAPKATRIILPMIELRQATVDESLAFLRKKGRDLDPDKTGVSIILLDPEKTRNIKVNLDVVNIPLFDAVKYFAVAAGLEMTMDGESIVLKLKDKAVAPAQSTASVPPRNPGAVQPASAVIPPRAPASQTASSGKLDELREHASSMSESVLGPLDQPTSASIRSYITDLREDIKDEMARNPLASTTAYDLAVQLCNSLIGAAYERDGLVTRLNNNNPSNAAGAPIATKVHPNWKDLEREREEAARATHNNTLETSFHKQIKVQWGMRATEVRRTLDDEIAQFRSALRQSPSPR